MINLKGFLNNLRSSGVDSETILDALTEVLSGGESTDKTRRVLSRSTGKRIVEITAEKWFSLQESSYEYVSLSSRDIIREYRYFEGVRYYRCLTSKGDTKYREGATCPIVLNLITGKCQGTTHI